MSRTYQVSRTMCCGKAPASFSTAAMFSSASFICATKPSAKRPSLSWPIMPPTNTVSPRARMPLANPFGRGQSGGCSTVLGALVSRRAFVGLSGTLLLLGRELVRGRLARNAAKLEALQLAGLGARQLADILDRARILVGRDRRLDVLLEHLGAGGVAAVAAAQHDVGLDDLPALLVGRAHHAAFGDRGMRQQRGLDLRAGDVVAGRYDHVVGARLVPEVAVVIHEVGVTGDVPAILHVFALALVGEVAAPGRPAHGEAADGVRGNLVA